MVKLDAEVGRIVLTSAVAVLAAAALLVAEALVDVHIVELHLPSGTDSEEVYECDTSTP